VQLRRIESRQNATIKTLRKAFATGELTEDGCVAIEGRKIVQEALSSGLTFKTVVFGEWAQDRLAEVPDFGAAEVVIVPNDVLRSAVDTESPQGVAALVCPAKHTLKDILAGIGPVIVLAGLQDPGNLGTILRSAEAFGATGIVLGEGTVNRFNAKAVRASAGSVFRMPCVASKLNDALSELKNAGLRLVGTSSHEGEPLEKADLRGRLALVIGNEGAGLSPDLMNRMDEFVKIPQAENVESLNAGVATSIILYEAARQRRTTS
jgi:RNA methyltransferase, TrmH family